MLELYKKDCMGPIWKMSRVCILGNFKHKQETKVGWMQGAEQG